MFRALSELMAFRGAMVRGKAGGIITSVGVAAVLVSCLPTEPCACPPQRSAFVVFGLVQRADGSAVASARIRFSVPLPAGTTACEGASREELDPVVVAGSDGRFRAVVYSLAGSGPRCLRAVAYEGPTEASDSAVIDGLIVQFRQGDQPDSLGVQLTIP